MELDTPEKTIPLETPEYSAGPLYSQYMGKCIQVVYTVENQDMAENALTNPDILILVKTTVDPISSPPNSGLLFDPVHFASKNDVPLRVSSACLHGALGDTDCLCYQETIAYMQQMRDHGYGVFVYMPQEAQGRGLRDKVRDHRLIHGVDEKGIETMAVSAAESLRILHPDGYDIRKYGILKKVFCRLGLSTVRFRYLGEDEKKRTQIVDETRLLIGKL